ncbi:metallothiol transferase FosB [Staphylococcus gallinarum]|uniref:metallothiol transferase FosB n=1 Tax=Staphylococcus gallinarum TaxID=1293 RepID=UPI002DB7624E|nr:metallothiol transferase FosB [Staphylococcus gallinarum]MEB7040064.1 metallothiol transferase FosB [Staphylococcus gallinarum]
MILGINHLTFSVQNLNDSVDFYVKNLDAKLLYLEKKTAYLELAGIWIALNQEDIPRNEIKFSYTHTAFTIKEEEVQFWYNKLTQNNVKILNGRKRHSEERRSIYFEDPDGHKLELHTGTMKERINFYEKKT